MCCPNLPPAASVFYYQRFLSRLCNPSRCSRTGPGSPITMNRRVLLYRLFSWGDEATTELCSNSFRALTPAGGLKVNGTRSATIRLRNANKAASLAIQALSCMLYSSIRDVQRTIPDTQERVQHLTSNLNTPSAVSTRNINAKTATRTSSQLP
jgi:hypothetical protein